MSWIEMIPYGASSGRLRTVYDRVKGPNGEIDNILLLHSLRPHTLEGHMQLYKNVLHNTSNRIPKAFLETIGVYVSILNACSYCVEHHFQDLRKLLGDDPRADAIRKGLETSEFDSVFENRERAILDYVKKLTHTPGSMQKEDADALRETGLTDGEILEINQVAAYFAYANRTVLGLGCTTDGDTLGLSPGGSENIDNWSHT